MSANTPHLLRNLPNRDAYVPLGDVVHGYLNMQTQYASRYLGGVQREDQEVAPDLAAAEHGDGRALRFVGTNAMYHEMYLHADDAAEFARRVAAYRLTGHMISKDTYDLIIAELDRPLHR